MSDPQSQIEAQIEAQIKARIEALRLWLRSEGRFINDTEAFQTAFVERLRAGGLPVVRFTSGVPSLHPQVDSVTTVWELEKGFTFRLFSFTDDNTAMLENSPLVIAYREGRNTRCDLEAPPEPGEFSVLPDLRAAGLTDYFVVAIAFSDGSNKAVSYATDRAGGFGDDEAAVLEGIAGDLAPVMETLYLRHLSQTLVDTYVGPVAGRRVLEGAIKRGALETIRAAIWFCDLRNFTPLSETLPGGRIIDLLNDYFDAVSGAIEGEGGEILKFIGDAVMAIFPPEGEDESDAAQRALRASDAAQAALAEINATRKPPINVGTALHFGNLLYGNVGAGTRLDFTVIGPAVNLASRIESMTKELGRPVLVSAEFAAIHGGRFEMMGEFELKGIAEKRAIYAPADE